MKITDQTARNIYLQSAEGHSVIYSKTKRVFFCDCTRGSLQGDSCCHKKRALALLDAKGLIDNDVIE